MNVASSHCAAYTRLIALLLLVFTSLAAVHGDDAQTRLLRHQLRVQQAQALPGLLVPLYVYPEDVARNPHWNRLIELKRRYPNVPVCAIVNPASGPGERVDPNYERGIRRLNSAGVVMIGYVSTNYTRVPASKVKEQIDRWKRLYPLVHGTFLDETTSDTQDGHVQHYVNLTRHAHDGGFWPVFANPGTMIGESYFAADAADVFVIHETGEMPPAQRLVQLEETPCTRLGILVYGQPDFDAVQFRRLAGAARWLYITDDELQPNPWDTLSTHTDAMFETLAP